MTKRFFPPTLFLVICSVLILSGFTTPTASCGAACQGADKITDLQTFGQLGDKAIGQEVDLLATVTYIEPFTSIIFVEDQEQAVFVSNVSTRGLKFGERVRVVGTVRKGDLSPTISAKSVFKADLDQEPVPPTPLDVNLSDLKLGDHDARYVRVRGTVLQAVSAQGQTLVLCEDNGVLFHVNINGARKLDEMWDWIGSTVDSVGVLAITLQAGTELLESEIGKRKIVYFRIWCVDAPEIISGQQTQPKDAAGGKLSKVDLQGQVISKLDESFVLQDSQKSTRIHCSDLFGFGATSIVRVAVTPIIKSDEGLEYHAKVIEELFTTRLPIPIEFHKLADDQRWKYVKAGGRPVQIRNNGERIFFDIHRDGKTAHIELHDHGLTSLDILENTRYLEVHGTVTDVNENGDCSVLVKNSKNISLIEPVIPIWKYLTWILLPITGLFVVGFVWVKGQRNRADSFAASIKDMNNRLVSTYQAINDGILAVDNEEQVLTVNSQFCELIGRDLKPGERFDVGACSEFLAQVKDRRKVEEFIFKHCQESRVENRLEVELTEPENRSFDLHCSNIVAGNGSRSGRLLILRDRTSERQLQAELIHSNKIEAVGQLVGGIAHDFNNILTTITANLSLLSLDQELDHAAQERVEDVELAASRGTELVRRLLTYSGKTQLRPETQPINSIIRELHKFAKATFDSRYRFDFELDSGEPTVHVDSGAIEQVILNIYLNARDAMPDGGIIHTQTKVKISDQNEPRVQIRITDNGPGVHPEILEKIFDPFFTTKAGQAGTGLGLSTSKRLILEQGGRLDCISTIENGSCFEIELPITRQIEPRADEPELASPVCQVSKKTVLVVDDEDGIRKISATILEMHGYDVLTAVNGEAALAVLRTEHQRIDMVLLDLTMPGISGLEVLKIASAKYSEIPVVLCSGYLAGVSEKIGDERLRLAKPFAAKQLIEIVDQAMKLDTTTTKEYQY